MDEAKQSEEMGDENGSKGRGLAAAPWQPDAVDPVALMTGS